MCYSSRIQSFRVWVQWMTVPSLGLVVPSSGGVRFRKVAFVPSSVLVIHMHQEHFETWRFETCVPMVLLRACLIGLRTC